MTKKTGGLAAWFATVSIIVMPFSGAFAADLVVLSAAAMKTSVAGVPAAVEASNGDHVRFVFGSAGAMRDAAIAGDTFDVIIAPPLALTDLVAKGLVVEGSRKPLGVVRLGVGFSKGGVHPAVDTSEAFKTALLAASSIGIADPAKGATSGIYLNKLFSTLGIDQVVRAKLRLFPEGQTAMEAVASGEIAMGLGQISEAIPVVGIDVAPLPEVVQLKTVYVGALASKSPHASEAQHLLEILTAPQIQAVLKANGFEPVP
jgi:molybdate transport system substrate-binding protein